MWGASEAVPFNIRKAAITIKADNKTAQAGSPLPELTYTVSGLAEKEQLKAAPELFCSADMNTAGIYPVTAGGAKAPDTDNYQEEIIYENGTLTVLDSAVHVTGVKHPVTDRRKRCAAHSVPFTGKCHRQKRVVGF